MIAEKDTVTKLIPQGPPMIMVDTLIEHDEQRTLTGFTIDEGNIFVSNGQFTESGLIENMAQSAALRTGWISRQKNAGFEDFTPPSGVIGSIKNFRLYSLPKLNSCLKTEIFILAEIFNATIVRASIKSEEKLLAEAELKIFITENQEVKES